MHALSFLSLIPLFDVYLVSCLSLYFSLDSTFYSLVYSLAPSVQSLSALTHVHALCRCPGAFSFFRAVYRIALDWDALGGTGATIG